MIEKLKGKKVLVTGGAGFIGSHIVDKLIELGAQVTVVDNLFTGNIKNIEHNLDKITFIEKSYFDKDVLENILSGVELISHQAALRSVPRSVEIPYDYHETNVTGILKLYLKAKEKGVKRIVLASSSSVYGDRIDFPEKENDLPKPISPYAASKLIGEIYGYVFSKLYGVGVVGLRYFNVFGPRQSLENQYAVVVPKFINCLLEGKKAPIYGDGNQERDFTYIDNVVKANLLALVVDNIDGEVFNVASGAPQSVNNLWKFLQEITGINMEAEYLNIRIGDVKKTEADITKTISVLGWKPEIDFYKGLQRTAEWFKNNR
jgi:UDP-N-acetylglucosamine/UDP-N-acetyl-alpha-D-glucosaminouronate 4-epimerase